MLSRIITCAVLAAGLGVPTPGQQTTPPESELVKEELDFRSMLGRTAIGLSKPVKGGSWGGTWVYISRDVHMALWFAEDQGKTIAKVRYEGLRRAEESFETDWSGKARYSAQNRPGVFEFTLKNNDPERLEAHWYWSLDMFGSSRTENADISMYRSADGRRLVMHFKNYQQIVESGGETRQGGIQQAWTFRKLSRRLALWEELPF